MEKDDVKGRIDQQIDAAVTKWGRPAAKLRYHVHSFKADAPKLETVVVVEIGHRATASADLATLLYFYPPSWYGGGTVAALETEVVAYLQGKKLTPFE